MPKIKEESKYEVSNGQSVKKRTNPEFKLNSLDLKENKKNKKEKLDKRLQ